MESTTECTACPVCDAPLHKWEYNQHVKGCFAIVLRDEGRTLVMTAAQIHRDDQEGAWRRNRKLGHWVPEADPRSR